MAAGNVVSTIRTAGAFATADLNAGTYLLILNSNLEFTTDTLEEALEVGGSFVITSTGGTAVGNGYYALYDDGANTYLALVESTLGAAVNGTLAVADLTACNLVTFTGVDDATVFGNSSFLNFTA